MRRTILWIDDFDNHSSHIRKRDGNKSDIEKYFRIFAPAYRRQVVIKDRFYDALSYIFECYGEFDCVILDIDLNRNFGAIDRDDGVWKRFFSCISIPEKLKEDEKRQTAGYILDEATGDITGKTTAEELSRNAGFYLVILLLTLGFPKERIILFSAFGDQDPRVIGWKKKFRQASLCPPRLVDKGVDWQNQEHQVLNARLDKLYDYEKQGYYFLRKLLFDVSAVAEESYRKNGKDDSHTSLFNERVREKDKRLGKERVKELFDCLVSSFSVYRPADTQAASFLYQSMKQFSEPFEADFSPQHNDSEYRIVKLFRNWSSHAKFGEDQAMRQEDFMLLFLIESSLLLNRDQNGGQAPNSGQEFRKILADIPFEKEDVGQICDVIYKNAWDICRRENEKQQKLKELYIPYNMSDVLHKLGNKKTSEYPMKYEYLWMAFICSCFEKQILHNKDKSISVRFSQKNDLSDTDRIFMEIAYQAWKGRRNGS